MTLSDGAVERSWAKLVKAVAHALDAEPRHPFNAAKDEIYRLRDTRTEELATQVVSVRNRDLWAIHDFVASMHIRMEGAWSIVEELHAEIEQLKAQAAKQKTVIYRGVHVVGEVYDTGDMVTCGGSLWHCNEITEEKPGEGSSAWTLAVKRGRDGKDLTRGAA